MDSTTIFSLVLLAVAVGLILSQRNAWRVLRESRRNADERAFAARQIRRRMWTGGLVGLLSIAILAADWIRSPVGALTIWCAIAVLLLWVILLTGADVAATRRHFGQLIRDHRAEQARWFNEAQRIAERVRDEEREEAAESRDPAAHELN